MKNKRQVHRDILYIMTNIDHEKGFLRTTGWWFDDIQALPNQQHTCDNGC
jgi:hypothetical protein